MKAPRGNQECIFCCFFNDTATTEIYTLSLHDALPISCISPTSYLRCWPGERRTSSSAPDRKSTRLNSSHLGISYAVFCLKKHTVGSTSVSPQQPPDSDPRRCAPSPTR